MKIKGRWGVEDKQLNICIVELGNCVVAVVRMLSVVI